MKTNEKSVQYEHSLDHCVEFFSKAGSLYNTTQSSYFYNNIEDILNLFQRAWIVDKEISFKLLLWVRDCRGGAGNRSGFRKCLKWLSKQPNGVNWIRQNIKLIPKYGRWDDMRELFNSDCHKDAVYVWNEALIEKDVLAAKWAKRTDIPLYVDLKKTGFVKNMGDFRRLLSGIRKDHIVESKMCDNRWTDIKYKNVPSVAMSRYNSAFINHDEIGMIKYKNDLKSNKVTINADVLFPHDCKKTAINGDKDIANAQFDNLPNYMTDNNIMVLCDSSGSMLSSISNSTTAYDVSTSLALYCSGKLSKNNPFYKKFIQFESESIFTDWSNTNFADTFPTDNWDGNNFFNGACGSTRIDKALDLILLTGKMFNVTNNDMPSMLLICSDMQFSIGCKSNSNSVLTEVEQSLKKWDDAGFKRPKIVYWNLVGYGGSPDTVDSKNIGLVSGFSPSILKSILSCDDFSPKAIMMETLKKYNKDLVIPK